MLLLLAGLVMGVDDPTKTNPANVVADQPEDVEAVLAPLDDLFAAFETGDAAAMLKVVYPDGRVTAVGMLPSGGPTLRQQSWTQFAERVRTGAPFQETISDPVVEVDGDIALVWAPFVVRRDGKVSNCGVDHFDLVRENGAWKVMNLTFSTRTTNCPAA